MKIAYLGPKGSFSHHVVQTAFPHEELQAFANITDVIKAYEQGLVDYSVVPVENSIEGSVHETLDYLFHQARIQARRNGYLDCRARTSAERIRYT